MAEMIRSIDVLVIIDTNKRTINKKFENLTLQEIDNLPRMVEDLLPKE